MKINIRNTAKIQSALDNAQLRARTRTITVKDIEDMCSEVEDRLSIPKKHLHGVSFSADRHAQAIPNTYTRVGVPESTIVECIYSNGAWYLTDVQRGPCRRPTVGYSVKLTQAARESIISRCTAF